MTREEHIAWLKAIRDSISGGDEEFDNKRRKSLDAGISALLQEPCERFEWGIDGNVYKITKAKDGKEICQQVCDDAISRKKAICVISACDGKSAQIEALEQLPSVTQKSGKWIPIPYKLDCETDAECSLCHEQFIDAMNYNFCPNCGCRMVEPQESEDRK